MQISLQNQADFAKSFQLEGVSPPLYLGPKATAEFTPELYLAYELDLAKATTIDRPVDGQCRLLVDGQFVEASALSAALRAGHFGEAIAKAAAKLDKQRAAQVHPVIAANAPPVPA
jgi:hypothetical protein